MTSPRPAPRTPIDHGLEWLAFAIGVVLLGLTLGSMLDGRIGSTPGDRAQYELRAVATDIVDEPGTGLSVPLILLDGKVARYPGEVEGTGWVEDPQIPAYRTAVLKLDGGVHEGTLRVQARTIAIAVRSDGWQGTISLHRNGKQIETMPIDGWQGRFAWDDHGGPSALALVGGAGLLALLALLAIRPWRSEFRRRGWLVAVLATIHLAYWLGQPIGIDPDSFGYLGGITNLRAGWPSYFPPGYSLMLWLAGGRANPALGGTVTLVQHGLCVALGYWCYRLLRDRAGIGAALMGGGMAALLPSVMQMSQALMSETLSGVAMLGTAWFASRWDTERRYLHACLAGLFLGIATLTRVVPLGAVGLGLVAWHLWGPDRQWRPLMATCATAALVIAMPLAWFGLRSGQPRLANSAGLHIYNRAVFSQRLLDDNGDSTKVLLGLLAGEDPRGLAFWDLQARPSIRAIGYDRQVALLGGAAREAILAEPVRFLARSPVMAWDELRLTPFWDIAQWREIRSTEPANFETSPLFATTAAGLGLRWRLEELQVVAWPLLLVAAAVGVFVGLRGPYRREVLAVLVVPASYLVASASLDMTLQRHVVDVTAFLVILAVLPLAAVGHGHRRWPGRAGSGGDQR